MSPDQIQQAQAMLKQYNYTPPATSGQPLSVDQQVDAYIAKSKPTPPTATPNGAQETGQHYMENVAPMASDFNDLAKGLTGGAMDDGGPQGNLGAAATKLAEPGIENKAMGVEDATVGVAKDAAQAIFAPIAAPLQTLMSHLATKPAGDGVPGEEGMDSPAATDARTQIATWAQAHPDIAKTLGDAFTVGTSALGSGALDTSVSDAAAGIKNVVTAPITAAKETIVGTPGAAATKGTQNTIAAIDPELTGAKAAKAYQQVVTGDRTVTPSGLFTEQTLSPAERTIQTGTRLSKPVTLSDGTSVDGITLGKDPVKNQVIMKNALADTESKLTTALKGDPEINFNADKPTLYEALGKARDNAPNEFRIGENQKVTKDVFNFANKVVGKADDSIEGVRDARTAFDNQAKVQYPNAFNPDGTVNVKTAAGNAVKNARDVINEHLYNTAPAGSDIQKLIGREADIFQANPTVSAKAAAGQGKNIITKGVQAVKNHPKVAGAAVISEVGHHLGLPGLPGF